jgi:hypothetical protein
LNQVLGQGTIILLDGEFNSLYPLEVLLGEGAWTAWCPTWEA